SISIAQPASIQMVLSGLRIVLPGLMLVLIAVALVRRNPVDPLFTAGTLLLTSSWLLEQLLGLPPHGITQHLTDLLLWASLLCYSWSQSRQQQAHTLIQITQQHEQASAREHREARIRFLARIRSELRTPRSEERRVG